MLPDTELCTLYIWVLPCSALSPFLHLDLLRIPEDMSGITRN